jgi:hypothetical protein
MDRTPDVDAISLDNVDVLSKWRVESEMPIMEEATAWLDEEPEQQQALDEQQGEEEHVMSPLWDIITVQRFMMTRVARWVL